MKRVFQKKKKKRVITKILNLDENNQYGFGMIKPLSTGFVRQNFDTSWRTFYFFKMLALMIKLELVTFTWLILNLIILKLQKNN